MSVVYDPKFLATIISLGQAKPDAGKIMSDAIQDSDYAEIDNKILQSLLSNLEADAATPSEDQMPESVSTLADSASRPTPADLNNVGNFVGYISKNQITYNGKPIVMFGGEQNIQPTPKLENIPAKQPQDASAISGQNTSVAYHYYVNSFEKLAQVALPMGSEIYTDASGNKVAKIDGVDYINYNGLYWVNKEYLTNYLYELQRSAVKGGNQLFTSMVDSLTNKINADKALNVKVQNKKDQLKAEEDKKKSEQAAVTKDTTTTDIGNIDQQTELDKIPVLINLVSGSSLSEGTESVKVKDLMSQQSFHAFVQNNKQLRLKVKINNQEKEVAIVGNSLYCEFVKFLNLRAKEKNTSGADWSNLYVKLTDQLVRLYCGSAQSTDLSSALNKDNKPFSGAQLISDQDQQKIDQAQEQYLSGLISKNGIPLPLSSQSGVFSGNISIDRITAFATAILKIHEYSVNNGFSFGKELDPYIRQFVALNHELRTYWADLTRLTVSQMLNSLSVGPDPRKEYGPDSIYNRMSQVFGDKKQGAALLINKILGNISQMLGFLKHTSVAGLGLAAGIDSNIKIAGELAYTMSKIGREQPSKTKIPGFAAR